MMDFDDIYTMSEGDSDLCKLNGWVLGSDPRGILPAWIPKDHTVHMLKERILPKLGIKHIVAKDLELWKVSKLYWCTLIANGEILWKVNIDLDNVGEDFFKNFEVEDGVEGVQELKAAWHVISQEFPDAPTVGHLHIIVKPPACEFNWLIIVTILTR